MNISRVFEIQKSLFYTSACYRELLCAANKHSAGFGGMGATFIYGRSPVVWLKKATAIIQQWCRFDADGKR